MGTVFIIDDDASVRRSLTRLLRSEGIQTESFDSATAYLRREDHDGAGCILLDINMPGISGIELQTRLVEKGHDLPVVFLTGHGDVSNSVAAMKRWISSSDVATLSFEVKRLPLWVWILYATGSIRL